jgi:hypothetical protein
VLSRLEQMDRVTPPRSVGRRPRMSKADPTSDLGTRASDSTFSAWCTSVPCSSLLVRRRRLEEMFVNADILHDSGGFVASVASAW